MIIDETARDGSKVLYDDNGAKYDNLHPKTAKVIAGLVTCGYTGILRPVGFIAFDHVLRCLGDLEMKATYEGAYIGLDIVGLFRLGEVVKW